MSEFGDDSDPSIKSSEQPEELPYRSVQFGKIYDTLEPNRPINIAALGNITLEIDEDNLELEKVSLENLKTAWERDAEMFTKSVQDAGITLDPFTVYKYYHIQRKVFQTLGIPTENEAHRRQEQIKRGNKYKLSEMKDNAMCSEYAVLTAYLSQKLGDSVRLIIGSGTADDEQQWRDAHAFGWSDALNAVLDTVAARSDNEFPAIMVPQQPSTLSDLENGYDISCTRIGTNIKFHYGLEAGGFGIETKPHA